MMLFYLSYDLMVTLLKLPSDSWNVDPPTGGLPEVMLDLLSPDP